jgi:simple sugar transport system ATP-binding protein
MAALLSIERAEKRYGAVRAVDAVTIAFDAGRIHAVVGENGAGKSTLLKVGAGVVVPDSGRVLVDGAPLAPHAAREAIRRGVGMVQQHFALVGALTALENVMLGVEPVGRIGVLDARAARSRAEATAREIGVAFDWDAPVDAMGLGDRQRLEIARALVRDARVLILDEPTAVLTPPEATALYATLRRLADGGRAVAVVTHRLDEVRDHADVVSVLRRGRLIGTHAMAGAGPGVLARIARDVMGEEPAPAVARAPHGVGDVRLSVRGVWRGAALRGLSLEARAGEIVGVAGVSGNGQRELVRVLAGLDLPDRGAVVAGPVAVVHEDRLSEGLVGRASVRDNLVLGELARFTRLGVVDARALDEEARARAAPPGSRRSGSVRPSPSCPAAISRRSSSRARSRAPSARTSSCWRSRRAASTSARREPSTARSCGRPNAARRSSS